MKLLRKPANTAYYYWRRNNWMFYVPGWWGASKATEIDRPVFLLGNQGDGITLISRFLRRHPQVVSATGNHRYWTGADEMQRSMEYRLPRGLRLSGGLLKTDPPHPRFTMPRSWSYASDDLWEAYHSTEADANPADARRFRKAIAECLHRFGGEGSRFIDKSQVFTLKTRYIQALLDGCDPFFVLITRNPYVSCFRAASGKAGDMARYSSFLSFEERFEICIQHWTNSTRVVLDDSRHLRHFRHWRYEDFLAEPEANTKELCDFIGIDFRKDQLPAAEHRIPFGTKFGDRWHPLRPDNNEAYLKRMSREQLLKVLDRCGGLAEKMGYPFPDWI